ncbi:hypothetical protein [Mesorhizobium sp.]|uniref:hypothetical protein n=1 Tax=Mesorhizobium sp. TaxID=1871066 RepID=UPI000FE7F2EF|nr:hypothetical protein [Mesorhizobium sp.]RWN28893.1 MAG: hypothetical protein EOR95_22950 [Mesorhizobium sp.]
MRSAEQRREADRIRKQEQRQRDEAGIIILNVRADEDRISQLLVNLRKLDPNLADDKKAIEAATEKLLASLQAVDITPE